MRLLAPAVAVTLFALSAPAYAGINAPDGSCVLFCNPAPAPSATPDATPTPAAAAPLALHHHRATPVADATPEHRHIWKQVHPGKAASLKRHQEVEVAAAPHAVPTPPVAPIMRSVSTPAPAPSVPAAPPVVRASNVPAPMASPSPGADTGAAEAQRLLAHALTERAQMAPAVVTTPAPQAQPAPSPVSRAVAYTPASHNLGLIQFTADGVVVPWWPGNFLGRFAIWLAATALIAASGFGLSKTGGRRLAA